MKTGTWLTAFFLVLFCGHTVFAADYSNEIQKQIETLKAQYPGDLDPMYFHDMGIIAKKADDASLNDLASTIIRSLLWQKMDDYAAKEMEEINQLFSRDGYQASRQLQEIIKMEKYFEPSDEFLATGPGQVFNAEISRLRASALKSISSQCSETHIRAAIQALKKTGLFYTNSPEEMYALRDLNHQIQCCIGWQPVILYKHAEPFETDYEAGTMIQEGTLKLETSPYDLNQAKWTGPWVYRCEGKEGKGEGTAQAVLQYKRGDETAELIMSSSRMTSVGRINMPFSLSGDRKTLEIKGKALYPSAVFQGANDVPLAGCRHETNNT